MRTEKEIKAKPKDIETTAKPVDDRCKHGVDGQDCFECFGEEDEKPAAQQPPPKPEPRVAAPIELLNGLAAPKTMVELNAFLTRLAAGGAFPKVFDTQEKRLASYSLATQLMGTQFQLALNNMTYINDKLVIYGELPGTLARRTGEVQNFRVYLVDEDGLEICPANKNLKKKLEPYAGVCEITRKGHEKNVITYTIEEAKKAGQWPPMKDEWVNNKRTGKQIVNENSPWHKHLPVMLMRKAQIPAYRLVMPESFVSVPIAEEFDRAPDLEEREVNPEASAASILNDEETAPKVS